MTAHHTIDPAPYLYGIGYDERTRRHDGRLWFTDLPAGRVYWAATPKTFDETTGRV